MMGGTVLFFWEPYFMLPQRIGKSNKKKKTNLYKKTVFQILSRSS